MSFNCLPSFGSAGSSSISTKKETSQTTFSKGELRGRNPIQQFPSLGLLQTPKFKKKVFIIEKPLDGELNGTKLKLEGILKSDDQFAEVRDEIARRNQIAKEQKKANKKKLSDITCTKLNPKNFLRYCCPCGQAIYRRLNREIEQLLNDQKMITHQLEAGERQLLALDAAKAFNSSLAHHIAQDGKLYYLNLKKPQYESLLKNNDQWIDTLKEKLKADRLIKALNEFGFFIELSDDEIADLSDQESKHQTLLEVLNTMRFAIQQASVKGGKCFFVEKHKHLLKDLLREPKTALDRPNRLVRRMGNKKFSAPLEKASRIGSPLELSSSSHGGSRV